MAGKGLNSKALRDAASAARRMARERAVQRHDAASSQYPEAALVARRVFNAAVEARESGESGDVSPVLWAPLVVAAEMMATVVVKANRLGEEEAVLYDVAAYFVAGFIAGGHGFDFAHFEAWRRRSSEDMTGGVEAG